MSSERRGRLGRILLLVGRFALAAIFLVAAYAKMKPQAGMPWSTASVRVSLAMFAMGVDSYQMLPPWAVSPVAHALPIFELVLGLSSLVSTLAVSGFIFVLVSAYRRGLTISCGCFGPGEQIGPKTLIRDGLLFLPLALAVTIGAFLIRRKSGVSTELSGSAVIRES
jgi:hypothetical protein